MQPLEKRKKNFEEFELTLSKKVAVEEARRFPQGNRKEDQAQCPLGTDIAAVMRILREGDVASAYKKLKEENDFPLICSRVCPEPAILEKDDPFSSTPIRVREIERFIAEQGREKTFFQRPLKPTGQRVAIVGSGPAGLSAASQLARRNYQVTIFEALALPGGKLRYLLPSFRLSKSVLDMEIQDVRLLGVDIRCHCGIGRSITLDDLFAQGFAAVLLAVGLGRAAPTLASGTHFGGVYYAEEFLFQVNGLTPEGFAKKSAVKLGEEVVVIGSDDKAADCGRMCVRFGKKVSLVFAQTEEELLAFSKGLQYAKEEGVELRPLAQLKEITAREKQWVKSIRCLQMDFADPQGDGHWQILPVPDADFEMAADTVILTAPREANHFLRQWLPELRYTDEGTVWVDEGAGLSSERRIFAAGDIVTGTESIMDAFVSGKKAARKIDQYLTQTKDQHVKTTQSPRYSR